MQTLITLAGFAANLLSYPSVRELSLAWKLLQTCAPDNISPVNRDPLDSCHWWGKVKGVMEFGPSALEKKELALRLRFFSALFLIQTPAGSEAQRS